MATGRPAPGGVVQTEGYYEELGRHPSPHRWAGWRGPLDHALRFEMALAGVRFPHAGGAAETGHSPAQARERVAGREALELLDLGCGTGELAAYLEATGRAVRYRGVDASADAIARARARHPGATFVRGDLGAPGAPADVVVAVGAMVSGASLVEEAARRRALARVVAAAWRWARRQAAVVVLDQGALEAHPGWRTEPALGGARADELARLGRHLAPRWEVRRGPLGTDLVLTLWRDTRGAGPRPSNEQLVRLARSSPWGQAADATEEAWFARALERRACGEPPTPPPGARAEAPEAPVG